MTLNCICWLDSSFANLGRVSYPLLTDHLWPGEVEPVRILQGGTIKFRPKKDDMNPFPFNENRFSFFIADHLLVGQLCTNPKSDRSLLSCLKVTQCSTSEIRDAPRYMLSSDPSYDNRTIASTLKMQIRMVQRLRAQLNASDDSLEVVERRFQVRATSCHLTSSKSAWKSTPKCTRMCLRVWWSPGAIRWPVTDLGCDSRTRRRPTSPKRPRLGFRRRATTLYPSLTGPLLPRPEPAGLFRLIICREHHQHDLPQHQSQPDGRHPPSSRRRLWKRHAPSSGSVLRWWLRLKAAT